MNLRTACNTDAEAISKILRKAFSARFRNAANAPEVDAYLAELSPEHILRLMQDHRHHFIVLEQEEGQPLGFVEAIEAGPKETETQEWLKLDRLYLMPDLIGQGYGGALLGAFEALGASLGRHSIWLQVLRSNQSAVDFYLHHDYAQFDSSAGKFKADAEIDLWLVKRIEKR